LRGVKKPCAGCGKQIPEAALHCVFCGAKQEMPTVRDATDPVGGSFPLAGSMDEAVGRVEAPPALGMTSTMPIVRESDAPMMPIALDPTPVRGLPLLEAAAGAAPFGALMRLVMASGGLVLITLFALPWRGVGSFQLLETLTGADFVRQLFFLTGGGILFAAAVLPLSATFRAGVGALVAALPLVLGAEGLLDGWRGFGAALAIIALPATHLMRARHVGRLDGTARALVVAAAIAVGLLYIVPGSSVVPLVFVGRLLGSMSVTHTALGLFIAIPLVLAALSLLGALGRDLTSVAVLLAVLNLLWAPAAVLIFVDDGTQLYLALALLWTSAIAALCVAQLLTMAAVTAAQRA
jgi:hypothetical protein